MRLNKALTYILNDIPTEVKEVFKEYVAKWDYETMDEWCLVDTPYGMVDVNLLGSAYDSSLNTGEIRLGVFPTRELEDGTVHTYWTKWESNVVPLSLFD